MWIIFCASFDFGSLNYRLAIHSDFIGIIQIFFMICREIQMTWLKLQSSFALNLVGISFQKCYFGKQIQIFFQTSILKMSNIKLKKKL